MRDRSKQIFSIILTIALMLGGMYAMSLIAPTEGEYHRNSMFGALAGLLLIGLYQSYLHADWIYNARLLLNAVALGLGYLIWTIPDVINSGFSSRILRILLLNLLIGFLFGLFIGIYQFFLNIYRKRKNPYIGNDQPLISSNAHVIFSGGTISDKGRALLLPDRLIFLTPGSHNQTVFLNEIKAIEIGNTLGFPSKLILILEGSESMALSISMPSFWKNKINSYSHITDKKKNAS